MYGSMEPKWILLWALFSSQRFPFRKVKETFSPQPPEVTFGIDQRIRWVLCGVAKLEQFLYDCQLKYDGYIWLRCSGWIHWRRHRNSLWNWRYSMSREDFKQRQEEHRRYPPTLHRKQRNPSNQRKRRPMRRCEAKVKYWQCNFKLNKFIWKISVFVVMVKISESISTGSSVTRLRKQYFQGQTMFG